ncbi:hypothetical protein CCP3SC1AL1_3750001 [Gammaproteobacteria bacterium]
MFFEDCYLSNLLQSDDEARRTFQEETEERKKLGETIVRKTYYLSYLAVV